MRRERVDVGKANIAMSVDIPLTMAKATAENEPMTKVKKPAQYWGQQSNSNPKKKTRTTAVRAVPPGRVAAAY